MGKAHHRYRQIETRDRKRPPGAAKGDRLHHLLALGRRQDLGLHEGTDHLVDGTPGRVGLQLGQDADKRVQEFEALQDVANSMRNEAEAKTKKYQDAANKAKSAADAAAKEEQEAAKRLDEISVQRENLVTQLASQKGTTAQIERDSQDKKEAKAKEEAEAEQQQTISDAEALFTENSDQAPVADATAGATDETVASETQSDTTTAEPAPAATAAPQPTAAATKAPTAAPTTAAPWMALMPTPPAPMTTALWNALGCVRLTTAPNPVLTPQESRQTRSSGTSAATLTTWASKAPSPSWARPLAVHPPWSLQPQRPDPLPR